MNDEFLKRLRTQPSLGFATRLKTRLDLQAATAASRKRYLYVVAALLIGGTALAFVAPPVRTFAAAILGVFRATSTTSTPTDASTTMPLPGAVTSPATSVPPERLGSPVLKTDRKSDATQLAAPSIVPSDSISPAANISAAEIPMHTSETSAINAPLSSGIAALSAGGFIRIDGSSSVFPITAAVAEAFQSRMSGKVRVNVGIAGTGGGFKRFCRGETDISDASRPILRAEMEACAAVGIKYIEVPVAYDALTVVVNPKATWVDQITVAELKTLWEPAAQRSVTRWNQVNAKWPNQPLKLFGPWSVSATFDYFTEVVNGKSKSSRSDFITSEDDNALVQGVAQNQNALGYVGYAYYAANVGKLKALQIVNSAGQTIGPSEAAILDGSYDPLSRPLFIYVNAESARKPEVKEFVVFYLSKGAEFAREVKYVPLSVNAYQTALTHFRNNKLGTVFGGITEVGLSVEEALDRDGEL